MNKITEEELKKLNDLREASSDLTYNIGIIEIHLNQAQKEKAKLLNEFIQIESNFNTYTTTLKGKYGAIEVDLVTGELKS